MVIFLIATQEEIFNRCHIRDLLALLLQHCLSSEMHIVNLRASCVLQLMNWTEVIWTQASWEVHHPIVSQRFSIIDIRQQPLPNLQEQCQQPPVYNTTLDVDSAGRALQGSWVPFYEGKHGACRIEVSGLPDVESSGSWQVAKFGRQQIKQQKKSWAERKGCLTLLMPKLSLPAGKEARQHMLRKNHAKVHIGVKQPGVLGSPQQEPSPSSATYTILAAELATPQKEYCSARWHAEDLVKQWGYLGGVQLRHLLFAPVKPRLVASALRYSHYGVSSSHTRNASQIGQG